MHVFVSISLLKDTLVNKTIILYLFDVSFFFEIRDASKSVEHGSPFNFFNPHLGRWRPKHSGINFQNVFDRAFMISMNLFYFCFTFTKIQETDSLPPRSRCILMKWAFHADSTYV